MTNNTSYQRLSSPTEQMTCLGIVGDIDEGIRSIIRCVLAERRFYTDRPGHFDLTDSAARMVLQERYWGRRSALFFLLNLPHAEIDAMLDELWDYTEQWTKRNLIDAIAAWRAQREVDAVRDEAEGR